MWESSVGEYEGGHVTVDTVGKRGAPKLFVFLGGASGWVAMDSLDKKWDLMWRRSPSVWVLDLVSVETVVYGMFGSPVEGGGTGREMPRDTPWQAAHAKLTHDMLTWARPRGDTVGEMLLNSVFPHGETRAGDIPLRACMFATATPRDVLPW